MLEDKKKLRQFVEGIVAMPEFGAMPVLCEHAVAEAVYRGRCQFGQIAGIADFAGGGG